LKTHTQKDSKKKSASHTPVNFLYSCRLELISFSLSSWITYHSRSPFTQIPRLTCVGAYAFTDSHMDLYRKCFHSKSSWGEIEMEG